MHLDIKIIYLCKRNNFSSSKCMKVNRRFKGDAFLEKEFFRLKIKKNK